MKTFLFSLLQFALFASVWAQPNYQVVIEEVALENSIGVHSYATALHGNYALIIGGRTDGLHKRRPFESFLETANNKKIIVIDFATKKNYTAELSLLPTALYEQLQATNHCFEQNGEYLYVAGGYGYSASQKDHITYPYLVQIEYKKVIDAVINKQNPAAFFTQIAEPRMAVTGGYLHNINDTFYIVGGQHLQANTTLRAPDTALVLNKNIPMKYANLPYMPMVL